MYIIPCAKFSYIVHLYEIFNTKILHIKTFGCEKLSNDGDKIQCIKVMFKVDCINVLWNTLRKDVLCHVSKTSFRGFTCLATSTTSQCHKQ